MAGRYYLTYAADYQPGYNYYADQRSDAADSAHGNRLLRGAELSVVAAHHGAEKRQQGFLGAVRVRMGGRRISLGVGARIRTTAADGSDCRQRPATTRRHVVRSSSTSTVTDGPIFVDAHGGTNIANSRPIRSLAQYWSRLEPASWWALPVPVNRDEDVLTGAIFADMDGDGLLISSRNCLSVPGPRSATTSVFCKGYGLVESDGQQRHRVAARTRFQHNSR